MRHRPFRLFLRRRFYRPLWHGFLLPPVLVTLGVAILVSVGIITLLEAKLRPVVAQLAAAQTQNTMTSVVEQAVAQDLASRQVSYQDLVDIQRDSSGAVTALTTDVAQMNLLRSELVSVILDALNGVDLSTIQVPLGSLIHIDLIWARGPAIRVQSMAVGTVSAEFESELTSAGVNQTLHRIWMDISVPMTVLLPGAEVEVPVHTRLPVAETVIVGKVPEAYVQFPRE